MKNKLLLLCLFITSYSFSCNCLEKLEVNEAVKDADYVFVGKILSEKIVNYKDSLNMNDYDYEKQYQLSEYFAVAPIKKEYLIQIDESYKGIKKKAKYITITSDIGEGGDCGVQFVLGRKYIIYANDEQRPKEFKSKRNFYSTSKCTRTKEYDCSEIVKLGNNRKRRQHR